MIEVRQVDVVTKARTSVVLQDPFFGTLLMRLRMEADDSVPTANIDGVRIRYNPKFVQGLDSEERKGLLVHEVLHTALLHHIRRGHRDPVRWNYACDYAINPLIKRKYKLPKDALDDPQYYGKSAEEIYNMLPKDLPGGGGKGPGQGPGGWGWVEDNPGDGKQDQQAVNKQAEAEWKQALAQARMVAKMQGKLPAELEKLVDEALEPVIDWPNVVRRFATEKVRADESWNRANRRLLAQGVYLPSITEENIVGTMAIFRDTSGSIYGSPRELEQFMGEMQCIVDDVAPMKTYVLDIDADVHKVYEIDRGEGLPLEASKAVGGGGTDFRPGFKWLRDNGIEPKCVVYLTDGYGTFPKEEDVDCPVMWVMTTDVEAPFGETVKVNDT